MDINIDSQIVVQTAAQWAADTDVYSEKRILVTSDVYYTGTDQRKFKLANGVDTWANLDYMPLGGSTTWGGITGTLSDQTDLQNALDNRNTNILKNNVQTDHTGTVNETLVLSYDVTGKFAANDLLMFACRVLGNATGNNKTVRVKVNTSASLVGAGTLATYTFTSTSVLMQRNMWFANTLANIRVLLNTTSYANDGATTFSTTNVKTVTHDFTGTTYILISCELAVNTDTISIFATELNRKR